MPIAAPRGARVIESRPRSAYRKLLRIVTRHRRVKVVQILLPPIAAIALPPGFPGLHPRIEAIKGSPPLLHGIFINQQGSLFPGIHYLPHPVPVRIAPLGENKRSEERRVGKECRS